ncbi:Piso0_001196 [Millerozyma farinosa CBS 7064]|uniref:Piso0_001196 protein n=1 Tax=Pichia sorbitophila (strain ATCC MYA-4447 / BCRC 22081 / CBS 7064 / NBRC 10061 / NRRL Y-12695) TaxID=559304 RepID=G8YSN2_PICSO|nr:Piso0_001196 [Millerozyma farinosa CBS 7064]CCE79155.1 Piso0_001196 [Millerozyma farinosa CBS 7064]
MDKDVEKDVEKQNSSNEHDDAEKTAEQDTEYCILTSLEKTGIVIILGLTALWSTLSSSIYFPALPSLSKDFDADPGLMNVSVVVYLICQGMVPTFFGPVADSFGRRPSILFCLSGYVAICAGLSKCKYFWQLVVLRCFQAAFIAPTVSIGFGVVGDMCTRQTRGSYVGYVSGITISGQGFGGLIGAGLANRFSWRGIFVFTSIGSGCVLVLNFFFLPETNRKLVGNLSVIPKRVWNKSPALLLLRDRLTKGNGQYTQSISRLSFFTPFKILLNFKVFLILVACGLQFATFTMMLTSLSTTLQSKYNYTIIDVGLCYLAPGMGTVCGSVSSGKILDWLFKRRKAAYDQLCMNLEEHEKPKFDIYKVRLEASYIPSILGICASVVFGWCIQNRVNVAPVLIAAFILTFCTICIMSCLTTLLVDLYPGDSSSSTSCMNLSRCLLGAAGVGALNRLVQVMGEGGCYTMMAGFCFVSNVFVYLLLR